MFVDMKDNTKSANTLFTSIQNMSRSGDMRYDASFLYYCICKLSKTHGQSMRYVMCSLLKSGLDSSSDYKDDINALYKEYESIAKEASL